MSLAITLAYTPFCSSLEAREELSQIGPFHHELITHKKSSLDCLDSALQVGYKC
jgi:hypothetical protein